MGCNISRPELRGRGKDPSLLSFNHHQHKTEDVPRGDPIFPNNGSQSPKFVIKQIIGDVSTVNNNIVRDSCSDQLLMLPEKDKERQYNNNNNNDPPRISSSVVLNDCDAEPRKSCAEYPWAAEEALTNHMIKTNDHNNNNDNDDLEVRGAVIPKFEGPLWIASPSFRDYCNTATHVPPPPPPPYHHPNSDDVDDDDDHDHDNKKNKNNNVENRSYRENHTTHADVTKYTEQKEKERDRDTVEVNNNNNNNNNSKRRRNLRKVLTLHRPTSVRNLFSVVVGGGGGGCYNPLLASSAAHSGARKPRPTSSKNL